MSTTLDMSQRGPIERAVVSGLRAAIHDHGPITDTNISSAAKRVVGSLKSLARALRDAPRVEASSSGGRACKSAPVHPSDEDYDHFAAWIRSAPDGPFNAVLRRWIVRFHIRHGGMPPLDLRPDWKRFA